MKFEEHLHKLYVDKSSSIQDDSGRFRNWPISECFLGAPPDELYGRSAFTKLPDDLKGLHIYLGSDCEGIVDTFAKSKMPSHLERLSIGDSSYGLGTGRNYEKISEILSEFEFPKLKSFEFGVWELFCNSHCLFGTLGNVTGLLNRMPNLERLSLYGAFELVNTLSFPKLKSLNITLDDYITGINGGYITQGTLNNLLESDYASLNEAFVDLECEDNEYGYKFTEKFLECKNMPHLKKLEITGGFLPNERERFLKSSLGTRLDVTCCHLKAMSVS